MEINYPAMTDGERVRKLESPAGPIKMVLDTDTFNEIDDQFAVIYALLSPERIELQALYAAPFHNDLSTGPKDGMEKSYEEIIRILKLMDREDVPVYRGSESYLAAPHTPVNSAAAYNLVERAMACDPADPLYVVGIGAITNIASAILIEPRIIERIVVVWLGGHAIDWQDTREFNLEQDLHASRVIFDSGVPLMLIPCMGVASNLRTTLSEVRDYVLPSGAIGAYLYETYKNCKDDHFAYSRVIWDISVIAWLNQSNTVPSRLIPSPRISADCRWSVDSTRHLIRCASYIDRDAVFHDLFTKLKMASN
ncbi:inosine-uridine nucleoside N-ribohydrolase [Paenibacillus endophyticus]|uniref:Inosine-uridine nucleoside N-ribohydrolase n=1 Tax=Paenibacillus endophyticus TaxID=1294268 RepID=A0A7W5CBQ5_9BACL|nr:nucleoside hydrolase [Paenibacillus endophyticus]MBB3154786.1 inosine-uridine nucleoside N-ribohydrolase [Paenibacillus endophyticus]